MPSFKEFVAVLRTELAKFAESSWKDFRTAAKKDGEAFLKDSKEDLERWTKLLARKELTRDDFEWLVTSKRDSAEMLALKQAGLTKAALDRFSNGLIDVVISTAFKAFL